MQRRFLTASFQGMVGRRLDWKRHEKTQKGLPARFQRGHRDAEKTGKGPSTRLYVSHSSIRGDKEKKGGLGEKGGTAGRGGKIVLNPFGSVHEDILRHQGNGKGLISQTQHKEYEKEITDRNDINRRKELQAQEVDGGGGLNLNKWKCSKQKWKR